MKLTLARVKPQVRDLLDRSGVTEAIGADHIYPRVLGGVLAHLGAGDEDARRFAGLSAEALRRLQQVVSRLLINTEGDQRVQLESLSSQLNQLLSEATSSS